MRMPGKKTAQFIAFSFQEDQKFELEFQVD